MTTSGDTHEAQQTQRSTEAAAENVKSNGHPATFFTVLQSKSDI